MDVLELKSYAKINLGLSVLGKRTDGYHDIETVFQQIDLFDVLVFEKTDSSFRIQCDGIPVPADRTNLVYRAFDAFRKNTGIRGGLKVIIKKNIPVGAGLGGGSSNAASALTAINQLWGVGLPVTELEKLALQIGSDVPFFICGGTAFGEGRGEILTPLSWGFSYWIVLIFPEVQVSTAWAYSKLKIGLTKPEKMTNFSAILENCSPQTLKEKMKNEFESVVFPKHPMLKEIKETLYERDAFYASMSGSGSTVFGFFFERKQAEQAESFFLNRTGLKACLSKPILSRSC